MPRGRDFLLAGIFLTYQLATASRNQLDLQEVGYIGGNGADLWEPSHKRQSKEISAGECSSSTKCNVFVMLLDRAEI